MRNNRDNAARKRSFPWNSTIREERPFCTRSWGPSEYWPSGRQAIFQDIHAQSWPVTFCHPTWPCWRATLAVGFIARIICSFWILRATSERYSTIPQYSWQTIRPLLASMKTKTFLCLRSSLRGFRFWRRGSVACWAKVVWTGLLQLSSGIRPLPFRYFA